ncbi:helix-turn-helix transcriptional regulator [Aerophototrophica crusticola]|uniref:Helix-turn-helix transcriptional regulator n=1 Tax=Aerophototrophica crusticola TaxID=1709002 RepID=A0A858R619_9PROT|nr:helix-turn-helix transcriptional regulator [Rhodospirillaceae bacterium B3]
MRKARRLTQEELAGRSELAPETISALERGENRPSMKTLESLATAFAMPVHDLIAYIDDPDDTPRRRLEREIQDLCRQLDDKALELVRGQVGCVVAFRS